jgi:hypothetical protein
MPHYWPQLLANPTNYSKGLAQLGTNRKKTKGAKQEMSISDLRSAHAEQVDDDALAEFKAKRSRDLMVRLTREMKARQESVASANAKADAEKNVAKEKQIQKGLDARVRFRILSGNSATEADVTRLFDKVRDELILEDSRKAQNDLENLKQRQFQRQLRKL